jgi:hypothetical protein
MKSSGRLGDISPGLVLGQVLFFKKKNIFFWGKKREDLSIC